MNNGKLDWVFAYGSNMNLKDLRQWLEKKGYGSDGIKQAEAATLPGYRLVWNYYSTGRNGGAANIEPATGKELPGIVLQVDQETLDGIDRKEGHPKYYSRGDAKRMINLEGGEEIEAWVYIAVHERCCSKLTPPRREYLQLMIDAAREFNLPHIQELEKTPTAD